MCGAGSVCAGRGEERGGEAGLNVVTWRGRGVNDSGKEQIFPAAFRLRFALHNLNAFICF